MKTNEVRPIDANALLDAMPKSDVLLRHQVVDVICNSPSIDISPVITGETSDGYHTFNELYHHRAVLFSVILKAFPGMAWKAKHHHDGTMYDGMFIVGIETPDGQATYHYDIEPYWDMFECKELEYAPEWDGHTPAQAIDRIGQLELVRHGRWLYNYYPTVWYGHGEPPEWVCSECEERAYNTYDYCPNCGAKMDGGEYGENA